MRRDEPDTRLLFHILRHSKLTLAFDPLYPGMRRFPYSFITLRWFYGSATGGAVVGKRPTTPLMDELMNWKDATIELLEDPQKSAEFINELLQDEVRLNSIAVLKKVRYALCPMPYALCPVVPHLSEKGYIYKRHYVESLARHEWRHRIQSMLEAVKIPLPQGLLEELSQMKMIHEKMVSRF